MPDEAPLASFLSSIAPFAELWKSLRITSVAIKKGDHWLNIATRLWYSELPPSPSTTLSPTTYFSAFQASFPIEQAEGILGEVLKSSRIPLGPDIHVLASERNAGEDIPLPVGSPSKIASADAPNYFGAARLTWAMWAHGPSLTQHVSREELEKVSSALRLKESWYKDVGSMFAWLLPGKTLDYSSGSNTTIEIIAPVPVSLAFGHVNGLSGKLLLTAPQSVDKTSLLVLVFPHPPGQRLRWTPEGSDATVVSVELLRWEERFVWPAGARSVSFHLYYKEEEVQELGVPRWEFTSALPAAVDHFFDPGAIIMREWLSPKPVGSAKGQGTEQTNFELAVVRLLVRAGIHAVWYGGKRYERRPDLAAVVELKGPPTVIVGECTIENPMAKVSGLEDLCTQLALQLGDDVSILPVVFTRVRVTSSDREAAAERRVALVGQDELKQLCWRGQPEEVVKYLSNLACRQY
jgi:hypothetical protein